MKSTELNKLLKEKTPNQILQMYMSLRINLTEKQLDKLVALKDGTSEEGHGGCNTK
jgi:hypothetical protein